MMNFTCMLCNQLKRRGEEYYYEICIAYLSLRKHVALGLHTRYRYFDTEVIHRSCGDLLQIVVGWLPKHKTQIYI